MASILSDGEIREALRKPPNRGGIHIDPTPSSEQFTTSAIDLRLGHEFRELMTKEDLAPEEPAGVERPITIDPSRMTNFFEVLEKYSKPATMETDGSFILEPNKFVLATTLEYIRLPSKIAARVEGRSTLARFGLSVHLTAPTIHAGFAGLIVLEMFNVGPFRFRLVPETPICQLIFERLGRRPKVAMRSRSSGQRKIVR
jgi:dCTP deaminase